MTVDDLPEGAREADRLGEQLLPEYRPSEIFSHKVLASGYKHMKEECDPEGCPERMFWDTITGNRYFAVMIASEHARDDIEHQMEEQDIPADLFAGLITWVSTGLVQEDSPEDLRAFGHAFRTWAGMRVIDVTRVAPADASGESIATACIWEGFQAGMAFAQILGKAFDAGSD